MRKIIFAAIMAATVGLTGCINVEGETPAERITSAVVQTCAFKPDISSVAAILAAIGPEASITAALVNQIANSVCASVGPAPEEGTFAAKATKTAKIKVGDREVVVKGDWVK